jgi:hypothetical protein
MYIQISLVKIEPPRNRNKTRKNAKTRHIGVSEDKKTTNAEETEKQGPNGLDSKYEVNDRSSRTNKMSLTIVENEKQEGVVSDMMMRDDEMRR